MSFQLELVLPCYNESKSLKNLITRAIDAAKAHSFKPKDFQLVIVENGSQDNSFELLENLKKTDLGDWFQIVQVKQNRGYGYGLWQGLQACSAMNVAWSHADQQCDPNDAFRALELLQKSPQNNTLVKGIRIKRNWKDKIVSRVFEIFAYVILRLKVYEINAQPKVFPRVLLSEIKNPPNNFSFDLYVLYHAQKAKYSIQTIQVEIPPRIYGVSNWASNFFSRYKTILAMIHYMRELANKEGRL